MKSSRNPMRGFRNGWLLVAAVWAALAPARASAQALRSDVFYLLPQESGLVTFLDLKALRASPHYAAIRARLLASQYDRFLRALGVDAEADLDWVAWVRVPRAAPRRGDFLLGIAQGRFHPEKIERYYLERRIPLDAYRGQTLFPFRGEILKPDFYLAFLDSTTAVFGHRAGLELLLETRYGSHASLQRNEALMARLNEVNGRAPAWAVLNAAYTPRAIQLFFPEAAKFPDFAKVAEGLRASVLRVELDSNATVTFQAWCGSTRDAQALAQMLEAGLLAQSWKEQTARPALGAVLGRVEVTANDTRVEARAAMAERDAAALLERRR